MIFLVIYSRIGILQILGFVICENGRVLCSSHDFSADNVKVVVCILSWYIDIGHYGTWSGLMCASLGSSH